MRCRWRELSLAGATLAWAHTTSAQVIQELGVQAIGTFSDPGLVVAGGFAALRTTGRTRLSLGFGAGVSGGELAVRGELLGHFLLGDRHLTVVAVLYQYPLVRDDVAYAAQVRSG